MKHVSPTDVSHEVRTKGPTRRALAKQQTRANVLAAARTLFGEHGYQGATIRDIAAAAGMSTGAVFANFSDKSDLFREIVASDAEKLDSEMEEIISRGKTIDDVMLRIFMAGYAFHGARMPLARAVFVAAWGHEEAEQLRRMPQMTLMANRMAHQLKAAIARGELHEDPDLTLRGQMLYDVYISNFQPAIFEGWTMEDLRVRSRDQIRILLSGLRKA